MKTFIARLLGFTSVIWNFFAPVLKGLVSEGLSELLPVALDIVTALEDTGLSGSEKFDRAVGQLRDSAQEIGIQAATSLLRFMVESAVQKMKAQ